VLDHTSSDYLKQLMSLTAEAGVELILEMAAHSNLGKDLTVLAKNGRVVVIGSRGPVEINPRDAMGRDADIRAMTLMNATPRQLKGIHAAIIAGLEMGSLRPVIGKKFSLAEAAKAHEAILAPGSYGKIVLVP
jgi:NADPH2:quinone reductase